jgi:hypothetical protein
MVAILLAATGCRDDGVHEPGGPSMPTPISAVDSAAAGRTSAFAVGHTSLGCADATTSGGGDTAGAPFELHLAGEVTSPPPRAEDVGLSLPDGLDWYFRKEPLSLPPGAADVTLSVDGPGQAVAWVSAPVWTSGRRPDLTDWAASSVTFSSCPHRAALFLGGLVSADLETCIHLTIHQAGQAVQDLRVRLDG